MNTFVIGVTSGGVKVLAVLQLADLRWRTIINVNLSFLDFFDAHAMFEHLVLRERRRHGLTDLAFIYELLSVQYRANAKSLGSLPNLMRQLQLKTSIDIRSYGERLVLPEYRGM